MQTLSSSRGMSLLRATVTLHILVSSPFGPVRGRNCSHSQLSSTLVRVATRASSCRSLFFVETNERNGMIGNGGELACDRSMMQMQTAVAVVAVVSLGRVARSRAKNSHRQIRIIHRFGSFVHPLAQSFVDKEVTDRDATTHSRPPLQPFLYPSASIGWTRQHVTFALGVH